MEQVDFHGKKISMLGFGCMRFPVLENDEVDKAELKKMIDEYIKNGGNYFDTAYIYHAEKSEGLLKECLVQRYDRNTFYIADKLPVWLVKKEEDYETLFNKQLDRVGVDYFDFFLLHALDKDKMIDVEKFNGFEFGLKKKNEGKIKHLGFSFHDDYETFKKIMDKHHHQIDFVQLQINYYDYKLMESDKCYELAKKYGVKVIVMEPVKGGYLANFSDTIKRMFKEKNDKSPASFALRYCASMSEVFTVLSGMSNMEQVIDNIDTFNNFMPLEKEDYTFIDEVIQELSKDATIQCTSCNYCINCPVNIKISNIFKVYNEMQSSKNPWNSKLVYKTFIPKADECIECGDCEKKCPQKLSIIKYLKEAHSELID